MNVKIEHIQWGWMYLEQALWKKCTSYNSLRLRQDVNGRKKKEGYVSNSGDLTPTGASRIHTLSKALAPYLRKAVANQAGISKIKYDKYVDKLLELAIN
ncbi:hypothetical protein K3495_g2907 [Podosphaera aphanis]|nr:hypothetical protein K3495_g2907 [Podosphaera aphanis]